MRQLSSIEKAGPWPRELSQKIDGRTEGGGYTTELSRYLTEKQEAVGLTDQEMNKALGTTDAWRLYKVGHGTQPQPTVLDDNHMGIVADMLNIQQSHLRKACGYPAQQTLREFMSIKHLKPQESGEDDLIEINFGDTFKAIERTRVFVKASQSSTASITLADLDAVAKIVTESDAAIKRLTAKIEELGKDLIQITTQRDVLKNAKQARDEEEAAVTQEPDGIEVTQDSGDTKDHTELANALLANAVLSSTNEDLRDQIVELDQKVTDLEKLEEQAQQRVQALQRERAINQLAMDPIVEHSIRCLTKHLKNTPNLPDGPKGALLFFHREHGW